MYAATQKFHLDVRSMSNFTYLEKLTYKLLTHMMKIWSLIKDRVLALNALQQVTVGLQGVKSLNNKCAFLFTSVADICHFLSFDLFRIKPLELNYKEYTTIICILYVTHFTYFFNCVLQTLKLNKY